MSSFSSRRRVFAVTIALAAFCTMAAVAVGAHWPQFGGDAGHSGHQPVAPTGLPIGQPANSAAARWTRPDVGIRSSMVISTGSSTVSQRVIFGADNGTVHNQRLSAGGQSVGPEDGVNIDDAPIDDLDTFGDNNTSASTTGPSRGIAESITPLDTGTTNPRGEILVLHNDDNLQYGGNDPRRGSDIALAQLSVVELANGQETIIKGDDVVMGANQCPTAPTPPTAPGPEHNCANVPNTIAFHLNASPVMTPRDNLGRRHIFFVANRPENDNSFPPAGDSNPCQPEPGPDANAGNFETPPPTGQEADRDCRIPAAARLFRVTVSEDAATGDYSVVPGSLTMSANIAQLNTFAPPALAFLDHDNDGEPTLYVLVSVRDTSTGGTGTDQGRVFGYPAEGNLRPATPLQSPLLGSAAWGVTVPTTAEGTMPSPAPYVYVAAEQANDEFNDDDIIGSDEDDFRVFKLNPDLSIADTGPFVLGNPGVALANSRLLAANGTGGTPGRVVATSSTGVYSFNSENLGLYARSLSKPFERTVAALSGRFAFVAANDGDQFVLDQGSMEEVPADTGGFVEHPTNVGSTSSYGQPGISNRWVVFGSSNGVFAYRAAEQTQPPGTTHPAYSISDVTQSEGNSGVTMFKFTVTRFGPTPAGSVRVRTVDGTAKAGTDYSPLDTTLTFAAGENTKEVNISVFGDTEDENDETFFVDIDNPLPTGATVIDGRGNGTIISDDPRRTAPGTPVPLAAVNDVVAIEGGNAVFSVTLSNATSNTVTMNFATVDDTAKAGSDYGGGRGTLTFTPGQTFKTISVPIVADSSDESIERFFMNLTGATNATFSDNQGSGLIAERSDLYKLPRVLPTVTASTTPKRDTRPAFRFTTKGTVRRPSGVSRSEGCKGRVTVIFKAGKKTISTRRRTLRSNCTYTSTVSFKNRKRFTKSGKLIVRVRFLGNTRLSPRSAKSHTVRTR